MPRGGRRPGAGRPKGVRSALPYGLAGAITEWNRMERKMAKLNVPKVPAGYRVPTDAPQDIKDAADFAFQRMIDVAAGRVRSDKATSVLKGAIEIRKEICGPIVQKTEVNITGRLEHLLTQSLDDVPALPPATVVDAQILPEQKETAPGSVPRAADSATPS